MRGFIAVNLGGEAQLIKTIKFIYFFLYIILYFVIKWIKNLYPISIYNNKCKNYNISYRCFYARFNKMRQTIYNYKKVTVNTPKNNYKKQLKTLHNTYRKKL